jgi:small-conductance mechanosensitive channel
MAKPSFTIDYAKELLDGAVRFTVDNLLTESAAVQVVAIAFGFVVSLFVARQVRGHLIDFFTRRVRIYRLKVVGHTLGQLLLPIFWVALLSIIGMAIEPLGHPENLMRIVSSLLTAWVVIRLFSSLVPDPFWARTVATIAWTLAALNILNLLTPAATFLDSFGINVGQSRITAFVLLKAILIGGLLLWLSVAASALLQRRIQRVPNLTPSVRTLIVQIARIILIVIAVAVALGTVGIDLTALAVFSGAVGVGVGFGLQKVVSNFVSGIILLLDRSIRPGDVIEIGGTYGTVSNLGARYTSIVTRDGTEFLVPNEQFITEQVINWAFSDTKVRRKFDIGISYGSDVELARILVIEACAETERVIGNPPPVCHLVEFGDNSVNLQARFWIEDPENGVVNVTSNVMRAVWRKFHENGIEFPFPQRDIHLRSGEPLEVVVTERTD